MKRFILVPLFALSTLLVPAVGSAMAQNTFPYRAPQYGYGYQTQLSPYLRMLTPGDSAVNYYGLVLPEFQRRQDRNQIFGQLQSGITNRLPARPQLQERDFDTPLPSTGHVTAFGYTGTYFGGLGNNPGNPFQRGGGQGRSPLNTAQPAGKAPIKK